MLYHEWQLILAFHVGGVYFVSGARKSTFTFCSNPPSQAYLTQPHSDQTLIAKETTYVLAIRRIFLCLKIDVFSTLLNWGLRQ